MVTPEPTPGPAVEPRPEPIDPRTTPTAPAATAKPDTFKRILAKFLDGVIAAIIFWLLVAIVPGFFFSSLVGGLAAGAYILVKDGLEVDFMRHRSLGKRLLGLAVVRIDGRPMDLEASVRRNWMFAVGYFLQPIGLATAALSGLLSLVLLGIVIYELFRLITANDGRRWGDDLAQTRVVNG